MAFNEFFLYIGSVEHTYGVCIEKKAEEGAMKYFLKMIVNCRYDLSVYCESIYYL